MELLGDGPVRLQGILSHIGLCKRLMNAASDDIK
ncbi:hypothetical protein GGD46_002076 [Rhizobium lusitanum]|uniref:Uncharacterized protein n=1 Tax=Rhizobium lusitanum TaxID=293958 RepID=A0A7X0IQF8_9HYPH|nr:hypothetical protein [Rhizobium lusitanum]